MTRRPRKFGL